MIERRKGFAGKGMASDKCSEKLKRAVVLLIGNSTASPCAVK